MAKVIYNGQRVSPVDRVRAFFGTGGREQKAAPLPIAAEYSLSPVVWATSNARAYIEQGYRLNSAVFACVTALADAFAEAHLTVYADETKKKAIDRHPLALLIKRPNEYMGEDEWWKYVVTYAAVGGNAYGYVVPSRAGKPTEIWPYNDVVMEPVPSGNEWVDHYTYTLDGLHKIDIPNEQVFQYKFKIDPLCPWRGMSALGPIWRETQTDNELVRYIMAVLKNDATPRGILKTDPTMPMTETQKDALKREWRLRFGGKNVGDVAVLDKGTTYERIAFNMEELAVNGLHGMNEARISAAFKVPALIAGLLTGLEHGREGNWESTRKQFYEGTMAPLWRSVASALQTDLVPLFGNDVYVDFDLSKVTALQENRNDRATRVFQAIQGGVPVYVNEAREAVGLDPIEGMDETLVEDVAPKPEPPPQPMMQPNDQQAQQDAQAMMQDGQQPPNKGLDDELEAKANPLYDKPAVRTLEKRIARKVRDYLEDEYDAIAEHITH